MGFAKLGLSQRSGATNIAQAAIADITEPKDRAKNFGLIGASLTLGDP